MKWLAALVFAALSYATAYTSTVSGNWNSAATWGGAGVPGNGDTATIATTTVVTATANVTVGTSGANGTTAVTEVGSGQLVIAGVVFTIRGNFFNTTGRFDPEIVMNPGSTWQFDSSAASAPSTTQYEITGGFASYIFMQANCTAISRCSVQSNVGGGNGYFDASVNTQGGGIVAAYTDFLRIDHFSPAFQSTGGGSSVPWNVTNSTFNGCGIIESLYAAGTATIFIHSNNVHTNTVGGFIFRSPFSAGLSGAGVRQLENNVFDAQFGSDAGANGWLPDSVTIIGNYFGNCLPVIQTTLWAQFQYNLVRETTACLGINGDFLDNYVVQDMYAAVHSHNPDVAQSVPTPSILRNIFDNTFFTFSGNTNDGVVLDQGNPGSQTAATVKYNLVLPAGNGVGSQQLMDIIGQNSAALDIEHNTLVASLIGGCVDMEYLVADAPSYNHRGTLSNNVCVALASQANTVPFLNANIETVVTDLFAPSSIKNNNRFNLKAAGGGTGNANEGNGYWGAWSVTPGGSDIVGDPGFVDPTRNMATFDSAFLGNAASATWASEAAGHTFAVGDIISDANVIYYGGSLINYRCIASHVKSTANSEPGIGSAFHTYWEFASLNSIRNAIAAGTTITNATIGASSASYIVALTDWVKAGFAPTNPLLHKAATDGTDIGAVAYAGVSGCASANMGGRQAYTPPGCS